MREPAKPDKIRCRLTELLIPIEVRRIQRTHIHDVNLISDFYKVTNQEQVKGYAVAVEFVFAC
jgi:hypothetical protein